MVTQFGSRRGHPRFSAAVVLAAAVMTAVRCYSQQPSAAPQSTAPQVPVAQSGPPQSPGSQANTESTGLPRWLNPATAPFIPIPEIDEDPYGGTTVGLIPTFLVTNDRNEIQQIIAPDVIYNQYFGYGARGRIFSYPSDNTQWSIVGGAKERVESEFDGEYAAGILRQDLLSLNLSLVYDRNGSPRYYGLGNNTPEWHATNFTYQQKYLQSIVGFNLTHAWQVGYTFRTRDVEITPGQITGIPSIQVLFPGAITRAESQELLNRVSITYDSRDDVVAPTQGAEWVAYAGAASKADVFGASLYAESGFDGRNFWSLGAKTVLAVHLALRYMPGNDRTRAIPFWALGSIGGDQSVIGGDQPLRGFGTGRFVDRNMSSISIEYRYRIATLDAVGTQVTFELTPFVDMGRVFDLMGDDPLSQLHKDAGIGIRGLALPHVVGYIDVGAGDEGAAIFTGINYPF
jgi:hypothetical protein